MDEVDTEAFQNALTNLFFIFVIVGTIYNVITTSVLGIYTTMWAFEEWGWVNWDWLRWFIDIFTH